MSNYRRSKSDGGIYFFTVLTHHRKPLFTDTANVAHLRAAFRHVMDQKLFQIDAMVVLPDHLHCIWRLPDNDMIFRGAGARLKNAHPRKLIVQGISVGNGRYGSGAFGSIKFVMNGIGGIISIIFITTPLNTVW